MSLSDAPPPYDTIVFDCDSTLSAMEGIEELAGPEHAAGLARMTADAMEGRVPLEEVYGRRLALVRPTRGTVAAIGERYVERLLPYARELTRGLSTLGKRLAIVSGGLLPAVQTLARELGVEEVHAVDVRFDADGAYVGFDATSPLARGGGKAPVLRALAQKRAAGRVAFVGDGITDLEAAGLVARFVAFGGVVRREAVFAAATVSCTSSDLRQLVPLLLAPGEIEILRAHPEHADLVPSPTGP